MFGKLPLVANQVKGGRAHYVGRIPIELCTSHDPTPTDVMGGRVADNGKVYRSMLFDTIEEARSYAIERGFDCK